MKFHSPLLPATLLRRYKRFLADVILEGEEVTVHCANTGSMTNCVLENSPCWLSTAPNPKRKYPYTLEIVTTPTMHLAGVNTLRANNLVAEAIDRCAIPELRQFSGYKREVPFDGGGRADFLLHAPGESGSPHCYLEVKSVTYGVEDGIGLFPDAKSERASRHVSELIALRARGISSMLFFCVQHSGIDIVRPAEHIDPIYASRLREAVSVGVEVLVYGCKLSAEEIVIEKRLALEL